MTAPLDDEALAALEAKIAGATPGDWYVIQGAAGELDSVAVGMRRHPFKIGRGIDPADAAFIAAADPVTVAALVKRVRELERERDYYRDTPQTSAGSTLDDLRRMNVEMRREADAIRIERDDWQKAAVDVGHMQSEAVKRQVAAQTETLRVLGELSALRDGIRALVDDWSVVFGPGSTMKGAQMWRELRALLGDNEGNPA